MLEFSEDKFIGDIQVTRKISENMIEEVVVNFYESGYSNWAVLPRGEEWEKDRPKEEEPRASWATKKLLEGHKIKFVEMPDDDDQDIQNGQDRVWMLELDKLLSGIQLFAQNPNNNLDNMDVVSYDMIMQYALVGEIEFS